MCSLSFVAEFEEAENDVGGFYEWGRGNLEGITDYRIVVMI